MPSTKGVGFLRGRAEDSQVCARTFSSSSQHEHGGASYAVEETTTICIWQQQTKEPWYSSQRYPVLFSGEPCKFKFHLTLHARPYIEVSGALHHDIRRTIDATTLSTKDPLPRAPSNVTAAEPH